MIHNKTLYRGSVPINAKDTCNHENQLAQATVLACDTIWGKQKWGPIRYSVVEFFLNEGSVLPDHNVLRNLQIDNDTYTHNDITIVRKSSQILRALTGVCGPTKIIPMDPPPVAAMDRANVNPANSRNRLTTMYNHFSSPHLHQYCCSG